MNEYQTTLESMADSLKILADNVKQKQELDATWAAIVQKRNRLMAEYYQSDWEKYKAERDALEAKIVEA